MLTPEKDQARPDARGLTMARYSANDQPHIDMHSKESPQQAGTPAFPAVAGPDASPMPEAQLAAMILEWEQVEAALSPVIGHRGVAALFKRSLFLTAPAHPWLGFPQEGMPLKLELGPLRSALAAQPGAEATAGGAALLKTFSELLTSLIGASLTERLLRSARAHPPGGPPITDPSP